MVKSRRYWIVCSAQCAPGELALFRGSFILYNTDLIFLVSSIDEVEKNHKDSNLV